jgi:hypothetical protein
MHRMQAVQMQPGHGVSWVEGLSGTGCDLKVGPFVTY